MKPPLHNWLRRNWELIFVISVCVILTTWVLISGCAKPLAPPPPDPKPPFEIRVETVQDMAVLVKGIPIGWQIISLPENGEIYVWGVFITPEMLPYTVPTNPMGPLSEEQAVLFAVTERKLNGRDH